MSFDVCTPIYNKALKLSTDNTTGVLPRKLELTGQDSSSEIFYRITIQAPISSSFNESYTLTLPSDAGTVGYVLVTDGTGILSWSSGISLGVFQETIYGTIYGGSGSGFSLTTGADNFFAGLRTGRTATTASNNIAIGNDSLFSMVDTTSGNNEANVAIGIAALETANSSTTNENMGNVAIGFEALNNLTTGSGNVSVGYTSGISITTEDNCILIGNASDGQADNVIAIGNSASSGASQAITIGNSSTVSGSGSIAIGNSLTITGSSQVCIGISPDATTSGATYVRHRTITGGVTSAGWLSNELVDASSSIRFKENVRDWKSEENKIDLIRPVIYNAKEGYGNYEGDTNDYVGFIAEEIQKIYPEFVSYENDNITPKSVTYDRMVVLLVDEIKKLRERVTELEKKCVV